MVRKMKIKRIFATVVVLALALINHGCNDGELLLSRSTQPSVSPFIAITADPMEINAGGSTTLKWVVANAASVEISSDDGTFHAGPIDMTGRTEDQIQVDDIQHTTTYTITATSAVIDASVNPIPHDPYIPVNTLKSGQIEMPGEEEDVEAETDIAATTTVTDSVTVTVIDSDLSIIFYADDGDSMACMPRVLHWEVTPSDATIEISSSTGETVELSDTCVPVVAPAPTPETDDGPRYRTKATSISKSTTASMPATGCAIVYPCVTTTYTLTATAQSGVMSEDVTIVPSNLIIDYDKTFITANGERSAAYVNSFPAEAVPIAYQISPSLIPVTVEADKSVGCTLPENRLLAQMPETTNCDISEETTFKLMAHVGNDLIEVSRVKVMADPSSGRVDITTAHAWAFEGEEVTITVTPRTEGDAAKIAKVRIKGTDIIERIVTDATPIVERVTVPLMGVQVEVFSTTDEDPVTQQAVYALPLLPVGLIGRPITEAMFDPNDIERSYYGTMVDFEAEGVTTFLTSNISIWRNDILVSGENAQPSGQIDINFGNRMIYWFNDGGAGNFGTALGDSLFINATRTYPVRAIAIADGDPDKMFVGTTGAVMYSFDGGTTWEVFVGPYYTKGQYVDNYPGEHESCAGETQTGMANPDDEDLAFFSGVCDIIVDGDRLYVATDKGAATYTDIPALIENPMVEGGVHFIPRSEEAKALLPTYKHVVNDLELLSDGNSKKLFAAVSTGTLNTAATVNGVFVSEDEGESWSEFGSLGVDVYAVKVDMHADDAVAIYAAAADGIYVSDIDTANWTKVYDGAAYSLADDPYTTGTIMAGFADGAKITRDAGNDWGPLMVGGIEGSGKVTAIAMAANVENSYVSYRVAFASEGGFLSGKVMVPVIAQTDFPNDPPVPEPWGEDDSDGDGGSDDDGLSDNGDSTGVYDCPPNWLPETIISNDPNGDCDADGVINAEDNCVKRANSDQADMDGDGRGDTCDNDS